MKKLFTLLFALGCLSSAFAQYRNDDRGSRSDRNDNNGNYSNSDKRGRDYAYNDRRDNDRRDNDAFSMTSRERDFKIQKINREYSYKISSVIDNRYMRPREKNWQVENLKRQRYDELRNVELCFKDSRNRYSTRW